MAFVVTFAGIVGVIFGETSGLTVLMSGLTAGAIASAVAGYFAVRGHRIDAGVSMEQVRVASRETAIKEFGVIKLFLEGRITDLETSRDRDHTTIGRLEGELREARDTNRVQAGQIRDLTRTLGELTDKQGSPDDG